MHSHEASDAYCYLTETSLQVKNVSFPGFEGLKVKNKSDASSYLITQVNKSC